MFTVQNLIDMLYALDQEEKMLPIMIIDYGGHLRSPKIISRELDRDGNPVLVLNEGS